MYAQPPSLHLLDNHMNAPLLTSAIAYSTFLKRKGGLFKKAHELSVLCSVDVAVFIFGQNKKLYEYSSADMRDLMTKYHYVRLDPPPSAPLHSRFAEK